VLLKNTVFLHIELVLAINVCLQFYMNGKTVQCPHIGTRMCVVDLCKTVQLYKTQHTLDIFQCLGNLTSEAQHTLIVRHSLFVSSRYRFMW